MYWVGARILPGKRAIWGVGISQPIVKYREYLTCSQYSQSYPVAGSHDTAFCCRYYSNLQKNWLTHTHLMALCPGLPGWAGTRKVKPIWILLKQQTGSGSGISWAIYKSAPRSRQINMPAPYHSVFYRPDALPATQTTVSRHWRQITEIMQCWNHINPKSCAHNVLVTLLEDITVNTAVTAVILFALPLLESLFHDVFPRRSEVAVGRRGGQFRLQVQRTTHVRVARVRVERHRVFAVELQQLTRKRRIIAGRWRSCWRRRWGQQRACSISIHTVRWNAGIHLGPRQPRVAGGRGVRIKAWAQSTATPTVIDHFTS